MSWPCWRRSHSPSSTHGPSSFHLRSLRFVGCRGRSAAQPPVASHLWYNSHLRNDPDSRRGPQVRATPSNIVVDRRLRVNTGAASRNRGTFPSNREIPAVRVEDLGELLRTKRRTDGLTLGEVSRQTG